jgi:hypothetical protein
MIVYHSKRLVNDRLLVKSSRDGIQSSRSSDEPRGTNYDTLIEFTIQRSPEE